MSCDNICHVTHPPPVPDGLEVSILESSNDSSPDSNWWSESLSPPPSCLWMRALSALPVHING